MNRQFLRTTVQRDVVESTSTLARELIVAGEIELPLLVRASRQTCGRGRATHLWWSDEGSLTFTIALDPSRHGLQTHHEPMLALAAAVAIIEAIEALGLRERPGIRWPNDIEAAGRKLGGILPERLETPRGTRLLIGIGVNVSSQLNDAPPEVRRMATSLAELRVDPETALDPEGVFLAIVDRFAAVVERLANDHPDLPARWAELDTLLDQSVRIDLGTRIVSGLGSGIDRDGALCLAAEGGMIRLFGGQVLREVPEGA